jgi:hypothetical protein
MITEGMDANFGYWACCNLANKDASLGLYAGSSLDRNLRKVCLNNLPLPGLSFRPASNATCFCWDKGLKWAMIAALRSAQEEN